MKHHLSKNWGLYKDWSKWAVEKYRQKRCSFWSNAKSKPNFLGALYDPGCNFNTRHVHSQIVDEESIKCLRGFELSHNWTCTNVGGSLECPTQTLANFRNICTVEVFVNLIMVDHVFLFKPGKLLKEIEFNLCVNDAQIYRQWKCHWHERITKNKEKREERRSAQIEVEHDLTRMVSYIELNMYCSLCIRAGRRKVRKIIITA